MITKAKEILKQNGKEDAYIIKIKSLDDLNKPENKAKILEKAEKAVVTDSFSTVCFARSS